MLYAVDFGGLTQFVKKLDAPYREVRDAFSHIGEYRERLGFVIRVEPWHLCPILAPYERECRDFAKYGDRVPF